MPPVDPGTPPPPGPAPRPPRRRLRVLAATIFLVLLAPAVLGLVISTPVGASLRLPGSATAASPATAPAVVSSPVPAAADSTTGAATPASPATPAAAVRPQLHTATVPVLGRTAQAVADQAVATPSLATPSLASGAASAADPTGLNPAQTPTSTPGPTVPALQSTPLQPTAQQSTTQSTARAGSGGTSTAQTATNLACGSLPVISEACQQLAGGAAWAVNCGTGPSSCANDVTQNVVAGAFDYFARWVAVGAIGAINLVWTGINGTTTPNLDPSNSVFHTTLLAARDLSVPLLVLAALYSVLKRDAEMAVKSAFFYLPASVLGMVLAAYVINALLAATDQLSAAYVNNSETGVAVWLDHIGGSIASGIGVTAPILLVIFSFVMMAASILLWLIMLVRSAAILITYAFMPLAFAGLIFPATRSWIRRLIEVQLSFILAKPVIMAVLALGAQTLNGADNALVGMTQAAALFFLAATAPFALMKLIPFASHEALHAMEGSARKPRTMMAGATVGMISGPGIASFLAGSQFSGPPAAAAASEVAMGSPGPGAGGGAVAGMSPGGGSAPPPSSGTIGSGEGGGGGGPADGGGGAAYYGDRPPSSGGDLASGSADPPTSGQAGYGT